MTITPKKTLAALWGAALCLFGFWFFLFPLGTVVRYVVTDDGLSAPGGSAVAFDWHQKLSGRYESYARERVASGAAATLDTHDIAGTEWPIFGSVFYLWATMQLQATWEADASFSKVAPKEYGRGAIEAATALVLDENHATWVKNHWGADYLSRENVFYRMLVMWAIIAHHELTGSDAHLETLRVQTESLAAEIDASPHGLLDDYPKQCYPTDVTAALAAIRRADPIIGTDHSAMLAHSIRGFEGVLAPIGLPPYAADAVKGLPFDPSRGCGNSYFCIFAPEVWPARAEGFYATYVEHFWGQNALVAGFREFPKGQGEDWYFDVDAGPVIAGFGSAASAFGLAAARSNGDYERAYSLAAELLTGAWPLPNGTMLLPRLVSNADHAPHLGEVAILFQLSRGPIGTTGVPGKGAIPGSVWITWAVQLLVGGLFVWRGVRRLRLAMRH